MIISLIVAAANNNVIGIKGQMPWRQATDMQYFKNTTWGMPVIMGRKTFQGLGKALPGRKNIMITRQVGWNAEGIAVVNNIDDALKLAGETDAKEVFVIGGGEIYKMFFERAQRIYLTRIHAEPEGDTFFPALDSKEWKLIRTDTHEADEKNHFAYSFEVWERR
ncbi:MAG: type 3 dihydrofolate reductase [Bacteroidetes bacterium]|nr:type 3 dihydrofolate reductase [Bacteroidota bacterium]MBS1930473.1 type 3 dihydrofolate reductase [Bacteroidota bacterium]